MISLNSCNALNLLEKNIDTKVKGVLVDVLKDIRQDLQLFNLLKRLKEYDKTTYIHCLNVAVYAVAIGVKINLSEAMLKLLAQSGLFHDIGKVLICKEILNKQSNLTDSEFSIIKMHPKYGADICRSFGLHNAVVSGVYEHHERYIGEGYPQGIDGEAISIFGRVLAVADVYDALVSPRPYHDSFSPSKPIEDLGSNSGYDKRMVYAFLEAIVPYPSSIKCTVTDRSEESNFKVVVQ